MSFSSPCQLHLERPPLSLSSDFGSAGAEYITLFPASSPEGRCLPPTNHAFASKISKLGNAHTSKDPLGVQKPERMEAGLEFESRPPALCEAFVSGNWHTLGVPPSDTVTKRHGRHLCGSLFIATRRREPTALTRFPEGLPLILPFPEGFLCKDLLLPSLQGAHRQSTNVK